MRMEIRRMGAQIVGALAIIVLPRMNSAQFAEVDPGMAQPPFPCVAIGDYDSDGDMDLLVAGVGKRDVAIHDGLYEYRGLIHR
jgi:hypothetical protein